MKTPFGIAAALLSLVAADVGAQTSRDAVSVDPEHHQVVLENDYVRVLRGLAAPGDRSVTHTHPALVIVSLGTARSRQNFTGAPGPQIMDFTPGQVIFSPAVEHSWELLSGQSHVVAVELKRPAPASTSPLPTTDAVTVDPAAHVPVLENEHVRVFSAYARGGARSPMHTHSRGFVLISAGRARVRLTGQDGTTAILDFHPGQVVWLDPTAHSWEILSGALEVTAVEVKAAQP
ncbi:MAG: hypothetical protein ACR2GJ_10055 [Gemmatimonadaceae bacterium]